jgi:predicted dinucleotide-binding enzyme
LGGTSSPRAFAVFRLITSSYLVGACTGRSAVILEQGVEAFRQRVACSLDAAKTVVLKLVEELGFDGVYAGGLDESWRQQPGTPVYTKDFDADGVRRGLHEASKDRTPEWRGTSNSPGSFTAPA